MVYINMHGNPYEMGEQHGKKFKHLINKASDELCSFPNLSLSQTKKQIDKYVSNLDTYFPEILEETKGISSASGLKFEEIIKLHLWEELNDYDQGCTTIVFSDSKDGPILGKTSDIEDWQQPYYMLQKVTPEKGYKFIGIGKVGSSKVEIGLNENGLVIGTGSTKPTDQIRENALERMTLVRLALQYCSNTQEAIDFFSQYYFINLGLYIVLLDKEGNAATIEKSRSNQAVCYPNDKGILFATNFYYIPEMAKYMDKNAFYYQNALERFITLSRLCNSVSLEDGVTSMKKILRDHSPVGPICAHFVEKGLGSFFAYIVKPIDLSFLLTDGYPCNNSFKRIKFPSN